jgi:glucosamine--fructose-6-phosphate aminotransferase (isomerizing)
VLRRAINKFSTHLLEPISQRLKNRSFDRIIVTGMGSSCYASYPAYLQLATLPIPVLFINTAELLHYSSGQIGSRTLLWLNSQSGRSAELVNLLERIQTSPPAYILASINDETSPVASAADVCVQICAGPEATVSTKTYTNMLAINLLIALHLIGQNLDTIKYKILSAADETETYLSGWNSHIAHSNSLLGDFEDLFIIGRGPSMSTTWTGALICKEAAKYAIEGINAADFRHGPLELVSSRFIALVLAGSPETSALNRNLATDIVKHGGHAIWLDTTPDTQLPTIIHPTTSDLLRPLVEILPLQLLTLALAERKNIQPGQFRVVGKVTASE